jgi:AcrR family transcriptional regulator
MSISCYIDVSEFVMVDMARKYRLKRRAESQEQTRRRIVEATVELHTTLGPAHTSMVAIAERAGVERPTLYRHFPTMSDLFSACSSHYWEQNPPPDSEPWLKINDPEARLRQGLMELYTYYSDHELGLWKILRDLEDMPELRPFSARRIAHRQRLRDVLASAWPDHGQQQQFLTAALAHAIDFFAWRSLRRQGLTNEEAIELIVDLVKAI